jgi:hypothetical protein
LVKRIPIARHDTGNSANWLKKIAFGAGICTNMID